MDWASAAARREVDLASIGLCIRDELGNRLGRKRGIYHHDVCRADDGCNRRDVADEIEMKVCIQRRIDRVRRTDHEERVAIGGCVHDSFGCKIAAGTGLVFGHEWLAKTLR